MSILIKNVQIVDGTGSEPYKADVFVDKNVILAIGDLKKKQADEVIEGAGNYLAPGFIDIDTSSDHYLSILRNPKQEEFSSQGVTTIIGGHCGSSLAPLLYGTLESFRKWADTSGVNVNWHTVDEFLETLRNFPLGVNFGTLVGYSTIRRSITGEGYRDLTKDEMNVFRKILRHAMREGAFGLSTGLGYAHGRLIKPEEIEEFVEIIKDFNGIYSTYLRDDKEGLLNSIDETIRIAESTEVKTLITHFRPIVGYEAQYHEAIKKIDKSGESGRVYFCVSPSDSSLEPIYKSLPLWAQEKNLETMLESLKHPQSASKIEKDLEENDLSGIIISKAPKHNYLVGKSSLDLSEMFGLSPAKALLKVMEITKLRALVLNKNINHKDLMKLLARPNAFIASGGTLPSANVFTKFLEVVSSSGVMDLPRAIQKITSQPADFLSLIDRGVIKEGLVADLVILDKDNFKIKEIILGGRAVSGAPLKHIS